MEFTFTPSKATSTDQALQNCAFLHPSDYKQLCEKAQTTPLYLQSNNVIMLCQPLDLVKPNHIMLNSQLRQQARISLISSAVFTAFISNTSSYLDSIVFAISPKKSLDSIDTDILFDQLKQSFNNRYFYANQIYYTDYRSTTLELTPRPEALGIMNSFTKISFCAAPGAKSLNLTGSHIENASLQESSLSQAFLQLARQQLPSSDPSAPSSSQPEQADIDISSIGIGGLNAQFGEIFRRAFVSRMFPPHLVRKFNLQHVRGILLYGPPGTGKTLIARKIGQLLSCKEPKIVSGPEILDMYVGNSEANVRKLFEDAEKDWKELGDESELHLVIMDELDAICKQRGSRGDSTGTYDSIVNQLLAKMDGVESLGNVLIVGMTNRKDLIDSALLRPGRFEVHVEIHLPNCAGRLQILEIHTKTLKENNALNSDVDLQFLAQKTQNFSGSEISGLVRSAQSFAMSRVVSGQLLLQHEQQQITDFVVTQQDFLQALLEVKPGFGRCETSIFDQIQQFKMLNLPFSKDRQIAISNKISTSLKSKIHLSTLILSGKNGSGKSSILAEICRKTEIEFVKFITSDYLVRNCSSEMSRANLINQVFEDANKVPEALIVLDGLEQILQFSECGMRYSTIIYNTIIPILKNARSGKVFVLASTNQADGMKSLGVLDCFISQIEVGDYDFNEVLDQWKEEWNIELEGDFTQFNGIQHRVSLNQLLFALEYAKGAGDGKVLRSQDLADQIEE